MGRPRRGAIAGQRHRDGRLRDGRHHDGRMLRRLAGKDDAHFAVILGDELATGQVQVRDLLAGTQHVVAIADLARELARAEASHRHG